MKYEKELTNYKSELFERINGFEFTVNNYDNTILTLKNKIETLNSINKQLSLEIKNNKCRYLNEIDNLN